MHDLVIRNGKIVDGSGKESFMGDIAIEIVFLKLVLLRIKGKKK